MPTHGKSASAINRPPEMPLPTITPLNEGMWRAAAAGRLEVQRCSSCRAHRYPPTESCYRCGSFEWGWDVVAGTGVVESYVWIPDRNRGEDAYYNVAVIALDGVEGEPVRVVSNVLDAWGLDDLRVGQPVHLECVVV